MIAILPIAPSLFRSTAPTLTFSPLRVDDPLTQLSGDSIEQLFERDTIADLTLTLDTPISELNNHTLREVFETGNMITNGDFTNGINGWTSVNSMKVLNTTDYKSSPASISQNNYKQALYQDIAGLSTDFFFVSFYSKYISGAYYPLLSIRDFQAFSNSTFLENTSSQWSSQTAISSKINGLRIMLGHFATDVSISCLYDNIIVLNLTSLGIDTLTVEQMDYYYSLYRELLDLDGDLPVQYSNGIYTNDEEIIYVTPLITAGQYSPLFDSTFDVMTDADIEDQLDDWLVRGFNYPQLTYELTEAQLLYFTTLSQEFIDEDGGLPNTITYEIFTSGTYMFDLVPLKANHQYSPLYMKTFDVMTDAEIIAQMNAWHYENLLP
jgi:hypothetical protein